MIEPTWDRNRESSWTSKEYKYYPEVHWSTISLPPALAIPGVEMKALGRRTLNPNYLVEWFFVFLQRNSKNNAVFLSKSIVCDAVGDTEFCVTEFHVANEYAVRILKAVIWFATSEHCKWENYYTIFTETSGERRPTDKEERFQFFFKTFSYLSSTDSREKCVNKWIISNKNVLSMKYRDCKYAFAITELLR